MNNNVITDQIFLLTSPPLKGERGNRIRARSCFGGDFVHLTRQKREKRYVSWVVRFSCLCGYGLIYCVGVTAFLLEVCFYSLVANRSLRRMTIGQSRSSCFGHVLVVLRQSLVQVCCLILVSYFPLFFGAERGIHCERMGDCSEPSAQCSPILRSPIVVVIVARVAVSWVFLCWQRCQPASY